MNISFEARTHSTAIITISYIQNGKHTNYEFETCYWYKDGDTTNKKLVAWVKYLNVYYDRKTKEEPVSIFLPILDIVCDKHEDMFLVKIDNIKSLVSHHHCFPEHL